MLRRIEQRGANETAHRVLNICSQVFNFVISTDRAERNPTVGIRAKLEPVDVKHFATITNPKEISLLLKNIDAYRGNLVVRLALKIAPYIFVRPSELRCARWAEFNFSTDEWHIPPERMKMRRKHIVPLAPQVVTLLRELHPLTGHTDFLNLLQTCGE
ncbi:MAG: tyrosine-type recombinase/integrase [Pseudomonadota bacterium]